MPCPSTLVIPRSEATRNLLFDKETTELQIPRTFSALRACERLGMTKAFRAAEEFFRILLSHADYLRIGMNAPERRNEFIPRLIGSSVTVAEIVARANSAP